MPTVEENLETMRANIAQQLADMTADPKPSYSIDGQSVSWTEHFNALLAALAQADEVTASTATPFEVRSRGIT